MSPGLHYAYRDPRTGFDLPAAWQDAPLDRRVPGWPHPLQTYRIGHERVRDARILPIGIAVGNAWLCDCLQYLPPPGGACRRPTVGPRATAVWQPKGRWRPRAPGPV